MGFRVWGRARELRVFNGFAVFGGEAWSLGIWDSVIREFRVPAAATWLLGPGRVSAKCIVASFGSCVTRRASWIHPPRPRRARR